MLCDFIVSLANPMDATSQSHQTMRRYQFSVRSLLALALLAALLTQFGPSAYNRLFPPPQKLPATWITNDDVLYFPVGPEFKLSTEAAALRDARDRENTGQ